MTIEDMRVLTGLPEGTPAAAVVAAYADLIDDGLPPSITLVEPVTVELARKQCRIDTDIEDDLIAQKLRAAREWVEDHTGRILAQQTLVAHFRSFGRYLEIWKRPIISIDAIAYDGIDDVDVITDTTAPLGTYPLRIYPATSWPRLRTGGGITVAYTAGYDPGEVPYRLIEAILVLAAGMLSDREGGYDKSIATAKLLCRRKPSTL